MRLQKLFIMTLLFLLSIFLYGCGTGKPGSGLQSRISGKTYVILGSSSGLGRGVAEDLGKYKANVVLAARRTDVLNEIAQTIRNSGGKALVVTTDISKPDEVRNLAGEAARTFGKVDVWINMAGVGAIGESWVIPEEDQARVIDVNLKGVIYGSRAAVDLFQKQQYGVLMNVGSIDSEVPNAYQAAYSATKSAVRTYSLALGQELRLEGHRKIKVVVIEPWAVDTPFWIHAANYAGKLPKFPLMDEPQKVVNGIIRKSIRTRKIVPVGWKAKGASFFANVCPRCMEHIAGNLARRYKKELPPAAEDTKGSIYEPIKQGTTVEGGIDEIMKNAKKSDTK